MVAEFRAFLAHPSTIMAILQKNKMSHKVITNTVMYSQMHRIKEKGSKNPRNSNKMCLKLGKLVEAHPTISIPTLNILSKMAAIAAMAMEETHI